ncbi:TonB-dependent receptor plug domain-containing protein [Paraflavisolibacter sp. H34]|uniref:TonB-dependent receptor n=1 Tax=Huijunlia imazamoxiresistens TaxID=3127457 RepID=UPI003019D75B
MRRFFAKAICLSLAGLLATPFLHAQAGRKGLYVANALSKVPVAEALVQSVDGRFSATADESGFVPLHRLPAGVGQLYLTRIGFEPDTLEVASLSFAGTPPVVFLQARVASLAEVRVRSAAGAGIFKTISDLDIHLRPINNSQEVLRMVPGLFIGQHAGGGKAEQIFLRGFDIDHGTDIHITVDGLPVNMVSHAHGQGYADLHFVIPELIEKVAFNKGPYFADKGNFTTAGFVEFKTKDFLEKNFLKAEGGPYGTFRGIAGLNLLQPRGDRRSRSLYAAGEGSFTRGYFDSPQDFSRFNGLLKYQGDLGAFGTLTASLSSFTSRWDASGQVPDRAVESGLIGFYGAIDNTEGGKTSRHNASLELLQHRGDGSALRHQLYYSRYRFELYSNFTFFKEDPVNGDQIRQKEDRHIYGYNGAYRKAFSLAGLPTETRAGVQLRLDDIRGIELTRTRNRKTNTQDIMRGDVGEGNAGAYWSQRLSLSKDLDLTAALRGDVFSNRYRDRLQAAERSSRSALLSPKLNLDYRLSDRVQLYLYNGRGFHSNDTRVAVQQEGRKVLPPAYGSDLGGVFKPGKKLVKRYSIKISEGRTSATTSRRRPVSLLQWTGMREETSAMASRKKRKSSSSLSMIRMRGRLCNSDFMAKALTCFPYQQ